jgi:hypothetical protein
MKALFHVALSDTEDFPKAIKWDEFKRAMVRIGFAVKKLQGSAWQSTPGEALHVDRGIHFHEPPTQTATFPTSWPSISVGGWSGCMGGVATRSGCLECWRA